MDLVYENPHAEIVTALLKEHYKKMPPEGTVLDLGCGDGVVTKALRGKNAYMFEGIDPYMYRFYEANTQQRCHKMSFQDIVKRGLPRKYHVIVCSFALHLCPDSMMKTLLWRLSQGSDWLVVISPTKFPQIGKPVVEEFGLTPKEKRIHFRMYYLPDLVISPDI